MTQASHEDVAEHIKLKSPPKYNVILMNDEATPQEFVTNVLRQKQVLRYILQQFMRV